MPTPGHCHIHSAAPGAWSPLSPVPPGPSFALQISSLTFPPQITPPPKCMHTKTIRVKPDRGELGPAGSPSVRETGVRTCPSRAQRLRASSSPPLGVALASRTAAPRLAVLTCDAPPGSPRPYQAQCGTAGPLGLRAPKRSPSCRAARRTAAALLCPAALGPARGLPMGAVRAPLPAASGAGPREPVGNRVPIGPPDNRSASVQPIRNGGYGSGAFGVGLRVTTGARGVPELRPGPRPAVRRKLAFRAPGYLPTRLWRRNLERPRKD